MTSLIFNQILLPDRLCRVCHGATQQKFMCAPCRDELPRISASEHCVRCALPLTTKAEICPECLRKPPPFDSCLACFCYQPPIDTWLHNFKYRGNLGDGRLLLDEFLQAFKQCSEPLPDALIPVPMPRLRQWQRGFNQTQWFSRQLSLKLGVHVLPGLNVKHSSAQQARGSRIFRLKNKRHAFCIDPKFASKLPGKHIALIDDVMTTGSTLRSASKILKDSGACRVDLWIIARTAKENGK